MAKMPFPYCCCPECDGLYAKNFGAKLCLETKDQTSRLSATQQADNDTFVAGIESLFSSYLFNLPAITSVYNINGVDHYNRQHVSAKQTGLADPLFHAVNAETLTVIPVLCDYVRLTIGADWRVGRNEGCDPKWYWLLTGKFIEDHAFSITTDLESYAIAYGIGTLVPYGFSDSVTVVKPAAERANRFIGHDCADPTTISGFAEYGTPGDTSGYMGMYVSTGIAIAGEQFGAGTAPMAIGSNLQIALSDGAITFPSCPVVI